MDVSMNMRWLKVFLIIFLIIGGSIFLKIREKKSTLNLQKFETIILNKYTEKLTKEGYETISYELNKEIQKIQKNNAIYIPVINLENNFENIIIKRYIFYSFYYKITIDNKDYIFKNKEKCEEFINNVKQYTNQEYEITTIKLMIHKETTEEDLINIITDKKVAYEKAKAEEEARKKAEQEAAAARKRALEEAKRLQEEKQRQNIISSRGLSDYQQYAHDLVINTYGWSEYDFQCLVNLWEKESEWDPNCHNNSSGAHGIPQALPASKMASEGADYYTNGYTQIRWGLKYIQQRYGSPSNAWSHFQSYNWY